MLVGRDRARANVRARFVQFALDLVHLALCRAVDFEDAASSSARANRSGYRYSATPTFLEFEMSLVPSEQMYSSVPLATMGLPA